MQPGHPLRFPHSPQGRALLCVAEEEGVGCALAASVSGFFSSVAMALKPTGQGDRQGDAGSGVHSSTKVPECKELSANETYSGRMRPINKPNFTSYFPEKRMKNLCLLCWALQRTRRCKRPSVGPTRPNPSHRLTAGPGPACRRNPRPHLQRAPYCYPRRENAAPWRQTKRNFLQRALEMSKKKKKSPTNPNCRRLSSGV